MLDDSIRTPEWFRSVPGTYQSTYGLPEPPGESYGPHGPWEGGTPAHKGLAHPPQGRGLNWTRKGGSTPLSFSFSLFFPLSLSGKRKGGRIGLGVQVGLLPTWGAPRPASSPLPPLYTWEGGASRHTIVSSRVPPPPQFTPPVIFS